ncbi:NAD-dependent epimerase/dehydratase family protein [Tissierella pigra]|uniref:NAD-dependent epimerase/dehydratase family protein n=1 Tax=Tissierella pigra TaxID=2607614 RepID=A0A6N7XJ69_9FIRM|nr:NAD-dependent epimerase/dehydratase family protein [Tissierella pigra]MSU02131.1 NAD-dependent epimerase/dehydratase family protein [Tissierella pigra]
MKKVLITGSNSYIGTRFKEWLTKYPDDYKVDSLSLRDDSWNNQDLGQYDVVYHTVGIAHIKETKENKDLYFKVNRDLTYKIAKKAKEDGIKQFIFLSTMSVYGLETEVIDENTPLKPNNAYGKSKLEAEELIKTLEDGSFKIAIIRPPMVYGEDCKGNYQRLSKLAKITPIFPEIDNKRSMIYIDNLSEFVKLLIDNSSNGLFCPQNSEYVNTSEMVRLIAEVHGKKIVMTKIFNPILKLVKLSTINKVFGDLIYEKENSKYISNYNTCNFRQSINYTEMEIKE